MVGNGQPEVTSVGARHESSREGPERPRAHGFSGMVGGSQQRRDVTQLSVDGREWLVAPSRDYII